MFRGDLVRRAKLGGNDRKPEPVDLRCLERDFRGRGQRALQRGREYPVTRRCLSMGRLGNGLRGYRAARMRDILRRYYAFRGGANIRKAEKASIDLPVADGCEVRTRS